MTTSIAALHFALSQLVIIEGLDASISFADALIDASEKGDTLVLVFRLPVVLRAQENHFKARINQALDNQNCSLVFMWDGDAERNTGTKEPIVNISNIVAVASGKGGVGKSTTAVNLALALHALGARVGVLDADIYGPSQSLMLGVVDKKPEMLAGKRIKAIPTAYGISMIGMGNLVDGDAPMAWRGPMAAGALQQLLRGTEWPILDYLIIDMPPGTGDIQLSLAQTVAVDGSVIVTTPQDIALLDAKKGIELFRKMSIDVLGVIENMSTHVCSQCGHKEAVFGEEGGLKLAEKYQVPLLGRLPLKLSIRLQADSGKPSVAMNPNSEESQQYLSIAQKMAVQLWFNRKQQSSPIITESND